MVGFICILLLLYSLLGLLFASRFASDREALCLDVSKEVFVFKEKALEATFKIHVNFGGNESLFKNLSFTLKLHLHTSLTVLFFLLFLNLLFTSRFASDYEALCSDVSKEDGK